MKDHAKRRRTACVALAANPRMMLLVAAPAEAKMFYITQGMGLETWVVALSARADDVEVGYRSYGEDVRADEALPFYARRESVSFRPAA